MLNAKLFCIILFKSNGIFYKIVFNRKEGYAAAAAAAAKSLQSCPILCNPIDGSPLGSSVPGILRQEYWSRLPFPSPTHESEK